MNKKDVMREEAYLIVYDVLYASPNEVISGDLSNHYYWFERKTNKKIYGDYFIAYCKGDTTLEPISRDCFEGNMMGLKCGVYDKDGKIVPILVLKNLPEKVKKKKLSYFKYPIKVSGTAFCLQRDGKIFIEEPVYCGMSKNCPMEECTYNNLLEKC